MSRSNRKIIQILLMVWIRVVVGEAHTRVKLASSPNIFLVVKNGNVGFLEVANPTLTADDYLDLYFGRKNIKGNGEKYLCESAGSNKVVACESDTPIKGHFVKLQIADKNKRENYIISDNGNKVLTKGEYNENTEMYDAIMAPMSEERLKNQVFYIENLI